MIRVDLINEQTLAAPEANQFQYWLAALEKHQTAEGEVCIKIVDEAESQSLNHTYRNKNRPTNVLSFPSEVPKFVASDHLGDLAICASVVAQEAAEQGKSVADHWAHMTIHGVLHLLGFDHVDDCDAATMESLEVTILQSLNIDNPYAA
ncbi:rRNA maturation RNase YbeY [Marinicella meishanensis]|uniref:rRNA maturation RNase YbeY n=1 Tax=Marinicella meishanensis TaxID=2873263 RepID=UPI001CC0A031|nr:rRNA maturation RNase YbeY [Marinicella sp. NBU2979]